MKMKKILLTMTMVVIATCATMAQPQSIKPKFNPEAFTAQVHEFITKEAHLTEEEQKAFFPIYDAYKAKERALFGKQKKIWKWPQTDKDIREAIQQYDQIDMKLKQLQAEYHKKVLKVLPPSKVMWVIIAEEKFRGNMFRNMARGMWPHHHKK